MIDRDPAGPPVPAPHPQPGARVRFLGSGDAFGSGGRFQTCILFEAGGRRILIDCGASSLIAMRAQGVDPNGIDVIVLTHLHGDHCAGVPFLLLDAMLGAKRQRPLTVLGPAGCAAHLRQLFLLLWPGSAAMQPRFEYRCIELPLGQPSEFDGVTVTPLAAVHTPETAPTIVRVACGGKVVTYTGDTEWTDEIVRAADGADLLVSECCFYDKPVRTHLNYRAWCTHRTRVNARAVVLTHMGGEMLARTGDVPERCAHDGLVIEL